MRATTAPAFLRLAALAAALAAGPAAADGGTVAGKVTVSPARFQDETVVYLKDVPGQPAPATFEIDQKGMKFIPLVLVVAPGDTVRFLNHDHDEHNVFSPDGEAFNLGTFKVGETRSHRFEEAGVFRIKCSIHPEMLAWVFVTPGRRGAAVDRKGRYAIEGVPPGTWPIAVWNPNAQAPDRSVTVTAGKTSEEHFTLKR